MDHLHPHCLYKYYSTLSSFYFNFPFHHIRTPLHEKWPLASPISLTKPVSSHQISAVHPRLACLSSYLRPKPNLIGLLLTPKSTPISRSPSPSGRRRPFSSQCTTSHSPPQGPPGASLCVAACELVGGDRDQAMAAAAAIHLMHAAAYTHEHLPLTDRPRPRPGIQHKYNPNIELLTGDGIIPFGFELLARSVGPDRSNPDKILRVIVEITRAAGSQGMVDGQYQELGLDRLGSEYDVIEYVCKKKEGELHACGAACGAILGGGAEEEIESLRRFGLYAGTVQGIQGKNKAGFMEEKIEKLKELALKELERLPGKKSTELISSLVEPSLAAVQIS
ncbi:UNVERIFIED_CONTAM: Heterodimeric geranylgeranyl pyrophosphate synthase small subunit, chloroplastic [Sesamum radiatum]|uniref:Heterodimeric geranylgeranyl pyrophosphate synthase small subunit, chloroplastic n=1 Tax=Sesamum radiatum TaxID=300843 RepID=A0AAW2T4W3_SESRA